MGQKQWARHGPEENFESLGATTAWARLPGLQESEAFVCAQQKSLKEACHWVNLLFLDSNFPDDIFRLNFSPELSKN